MDAKQSCKYFHMPEINFGPLTSNWVHFPLLTLEALRHPSNFQQIFQWWSIFPWFHTEHDRRVGESEKEKPLGSRFLQQPNCLYEIVLQTHHNADKLLRCLNTSLLIKYNIIHTHTHIHNKYMYLHTERILFLLENCTYSTLLCDMQYRQMVGGLFGKQIRPTKGYYNISRIGM